MIRAAGCIGYPCAWNWPREQILPQEAGNGVLGHGWTISGIWIIIQLLRNQMDFRWKLLKKVLRLKHECCAKSSRRSKAIATLCSQLHL